MQDTMTPIDIIPWICNDGEIFEHAKCPWCGSDNVTRFQWVDNDAFLYMTCWDCDSPFTLEK